MLSQNDNRPVLVGIPGLLGGQADFMRFEEPFKDLFRFFVFDPNATRKLSSLDASAVQEIDYYATAPLLLQQLEEFAPGQPCYLFGVSIGGKVVFDFARRYPERFLGGLATDVGPGSIMQSELFISVEGRIMKCNLQQPWPELRNHLRDVFPEKALRILVQSQVGYGEDKSKAFWRTGMANLRKLLIHKSLDDQWETFLPADSKLADSGKFITIMHASTLSGVSPEDHSKLPSLRSIRMVDVDNSTHFMHAECPDDILKQIHISFLNKKSEVAV